MTLLSYFTEKKNTSHRKPFIFIKSDLYRGTSGSIWPTIPPAIMEFSLFQSKANPFNCALESIHFYLVRNLIVLTILSYWSIQPLLPNGYLLLVFKPLTVFHITLKRINKIILNPRCELSYVLHKVEIPSLSTSEYNIYLKIGSLKRQLNWGWKHINE